MSFLSILPTLVLGISSVMIYLSGMAYFGILPSEAQIFMNCFENFFGNAVTPELGFQDNQQHGPLSPLGVGNADGRRLLDRIMGADGVFQVK